MVRVRMLWVGKADEGEEGLINQVFESLVRRTYARDAGTVSGMPS